MTSQFFPHFFLNTAESHSYKGRGQGGAKYPVRNRLTHSEKLKKQFENLWTVSPESNGAVSTSSNDGVYVEFRNLPGYDIKFESLESRKDGIRLLNIRERKIAGKVERLATVYIPKDRRNIFLNKLNQYINEETEKGKPKNAALIDGIEDINLAILESFWSESEKKWIPEEEHVWCEIWLSSDSDTTYEEFIKVVTDKLQLEVKNNSIRFPERRVVLVRANRDNLQKMLFLSGNIAEMRRASEAVAFYVEIDNKEQVDWARDLLDRLEVSQDTNVFVSVIDTGVSNGHMLLEPMIADTDLYAYDLKWNVFDSAGHGTMMSGIIGYGDLKEILVGYEKIEIKHKIESLKIIPDKGENPPELYGDITEQVISSAIIDNPDRQRVICMAVTAPNYQTDDGRPSSWSASLDRITSGSIDGTHKVFLVSAGNNFINHKDEYPDSNYTSVVQNPGQSWNSLTVGAYTDLYNPYKTYTPLAPKGGLSPHSTTSFSWDKNKWPIKPEIVLEGGNLIVDKYGAYSDTDHSILTTSHNLPREQFTTFNATSAATAKASWMAAQIQSKYPEAWPETVRGLMVHSAEWTEELKKQFLEGSDKKHYHNLARMCGYGVPNLERALQGLKNNVSMIVQSKLMPFKKHNSSIALNEMHLHKLPWPKEVLLSLGELDVKLRITLSYYIEPSPGEVGWKSRYSYASYGLRFDMNGTATEEQFIKRINQAAKDEEDGKTQSSNIDWTLGPNTRNKGSIHSDIWETTASQLATSNMIGIYPISGWWSKRPWLDQWSGEVNYTLIVTLSTPATNIDLYTPIELASKINNKIVIKDN
ncbi:S8 family peptidase [Paenibacillus arenosi]|uniref:S8 family peptidase n=1 Tax=Paenibacillus arenosi TaxID=2774142 RepID=A0ABR9AV28_9BACL|nr:S8 family peptidase [Paenibacillus arenosi]MBD8497983.1 S8 family peptidase [Paenibacillus arenosi]